MGLKPSYFFDLDYKKDSGLESFDLEIILNRLKLKLVNTLQFSDLDTSNFSKSKVFLVSDESDELFKIRYCPKDKTQDIVNNVNFAFENGVIQINVLRQGPNYVLLNYIQGSSIDELNIDQIIKISKLHSKLNFRLDFDPNILDRKLSHLIFDCRKYLEQKGYSEFAMNIEESLRSMYPSSIVPVFDHQDFGIHNLIRSDDEIFHLVDEEAFGVMPFGYSLHRACSGRKNYGVCKNKEDSGVYLDSFSPEFKEYYLETSSFWRDILKLRSSVRALSVGNVDLFERLTK